MTWKLTNVDIQKSEVFKRPSRRRMKRSKCYKVLFKIKFTLQPPHIDVDILFDDGVAGSVVEMGWKSKEDIEKLGAKSDQSGEQGRDIDRQC
jgi:hypothetical protein